MLAILAAVCFAVDFVLTLVGGGDAKVLALLLYGGLALLALSVAGVGPGWRRPGQPGG